MPDHVLGCNRTSTVSNSSLPSHISKVAINIEGSLRAAQVAVGPNAPKAGPVLPSSETEIERTSFIVSDGSRKDIASIDDVTSTIHELIIPRTIHTFLSSITCSLNLIATTCRGCIILTTSLFASSNAIRILNTFKPPPVEPAEAPMTINRSNSISSHSIRY